MAYKQPENLESFLIDVLKQRKLNGNRSIVYTDNELQNIFSLYDLKGDGIISKERCREALKTLANSEFHHQKANDIPMPDKIDLFGFIKLCDDALGIKA